MLIVRLDTCHMKAVKLAAPYTQDSSFITSVYIMYIHIIHSVENTTTIGFTVCSILQYIVYYITVHCNIEHTVTLIVVVFLTVYYMYVHYTCYLGSMNRGISYMK
jgi:hypothetical protein